MELSIVASMYYSAPYLQEFYNRITSSAQKITDDYEIIFINDGSPDNSLELAINIYEKDDKVKIINLSRNFGHHKAMMTGLSHAKGKFVFLIDLDLEEEPELLEEFWMEMQNNKDVDLIYGEQLKRKGNWFERVSGNIFFNILKWLTEVEITKNLLVARLMTARYVKSLTSFTESEFVFVGISALAGYKQLPIIVKKGYRRKTTYTIGRKIDMAINFVVSLSSKPLLIIFYLGLIVTFISCLYVLYLIYLRLIMAVKVDGWTTIVASIWLLGGLLMFSIGTLGIYLSKVFVEVKNRPYTIIKNVFARTKD